MADYIKLTDFKAFFNPEIDGFKVDDRVRIKWLDEYSDPDMAYTIGATAVVVAINSEDNTVTVLIDREFSDPSARIHNPNETWYYLPSSLEKINE